MQSLNPEACSTGKEGTQVHRPHPLIWDLCGRTTCLLSLLYLSMQCI